MCNLRLFAFNIYACFIDIEIKFYRIISGMDKEKNILVGNFTQLGPYKKSNLCILPNALPPPHKELQVKSVVLHFLKFIY